MDPFIGCIFMFAGSFAPRGFALCQGQLLPIAQNAALFSILGTTFGGDGATNFQLPNLCGRTPVGAGAGNNGLTTVNVGETGGTQSLALSAANLPPHNHPVNSSNTPLDSPVPDNCVLGSNGFGGPGLYSSQPPNTPMSSRMIGMTGSGTPFDPQGPFLGINFIIALEGLYPPRD